MSERTVTLPNGYKIYKVPENYTDEEIFIKYKEKGQLPLKPVEEQSVVEITEEDEPAVEETGISDIGFDFLKVMGNTGRSLAETAVKVLDGPLLADETRESRNKKIEERFDAATRVIAGAIPFLDEDKLFDEEGKLEDVKTTTGTVASVVPYVAGGVELAGAKALAKLPSIARGLASGVVVDQLLADPKENVFNLLQGHLPDGAMKEVAEFMASDEDDSELEQRIKLLGEGLSLGLVGEAVGGVTVLAGKARKLFNKPYTDLTEEEQGELLVDYLKDAKETTGLREVEPEIKLSESPEGAAQIAQQNNSWLKRFTQQAFTSRGYFTPKAYNAFLDAENAQRATVAQAEQTARRLQIALDNAAGELNSNELADRVQEALTTDLKYTRGQSKEANIVDIADQFNLPNEVAAEVLNARQLIDETSKNLVNSSAVDLKLKEVIAENAGSYLRRSYRLFEDTGYEPTTQVRRDAEKFLTEQNLKLNPNMSMEDALGTAQNQISEILGKSGKEEASINDYFTKVNKVNKEILTGKKDIPAPLRKLMGEIENPTDNVLLTVSKASKLVETNRFYENLYKLGKTGKYIFDKTEPRPDGFEPISGTNSVLDGKWTTPEMITAIKRRESVFIDNSSEGILFTPYRNFLTLKGASQKAKTVYSMTTHARNVLGGAQFGLANGLNPFGRDVAATWKVLSNRITAGGQEVLDETYKKYLDLGIVNTNATVNEFRDLLNTGAESFVDRSIDKLAGYGLGKVSKRIEDIYLATDDFYKIINFNQELDTLKKAFPTADIKVLEREAASITQNTLPNYDRVPKGIKALKNLPIGSFVSFPAEIIRTSGQIVRQASREINSGSDVLKARGLKRLAGFSTTLSSWGALSYGTASLAGLTDEEKDAAKVMTETPWSKDSPRLFLRMGDKLYTSDTQFLDSYSVIKEPLMAAYREIREGKLRGDDLDEYIANASLSAIETLVKPYVEPTILSSALTDVAYAMASDNGRTREGKAIFTPGLTGEEQREIAMYHILDSFIPGTITSLKNIAEAAFETPNRSTGRTKSLPAEFAAMTLGVRFTEFAPEDKLKFSTKDYIRKNADIISATPDYAATGSELVDTYTNRQQQRYKNMQKLYRIVEASRQTIGDEQTAIILNESGLSMRSVGTLLAGKFMPEKQSMRTFMGIIQKTPLGANETPASIIDNLYTKYADMLATPLIQPAEEEEDPRLKKSRGGNVYNVPNAPVEPDERIDKMTGLPYSEQAGSIMEDEEDRIGFSGGGQAIKALAEIIQSFSKKTVSEADAAKAAANIVDEADKAAYLDPNISTSNPLYRDYLETNTKALLREKHDMSLDELQNVEGFGEDWEKFSINRGYDESEWLDFKRSEELKDSLEAETGIDFSADTNMIQTNLDNIKARDMEYPELDEMEAATESYPKFETFYEDLNLDKVLTKSEYEQYNFEVSDIRNEYEMEIAFLEDSGDLDGAAELADEMAQQIRDVTESFITPAKSQIKEALANEIDTLTPDQKVVFERIYDRMPERSSGIKEVIKDPSDAATFTKDSVIKEPVYRGTYSGFNFEHDIAFALPRELGTHVGTRGQANAILLKAMDNDVRKFAEKYMDETTLDEIYTYTDPDYNMPLAMSKGYIDVKNPLVIEKDLGIWDAFNIANDPMLRSDLIEAVTNHFKETGEDVGMGRLNNFLDKLSAPSFRDANASALAPENEDFFGNILKADLNIQLRELLENVYGFDGIKYKNVGEDSLPGEEAYSYILFKPNQFKNVNAAAFDPEDVREMFAEGGLIEKGVRYLIEKGGEMLGVGPKNQRLNEKKVITFINDGIERGIIPPEYKIPVDDNGFGDFRKPHNEELFNAFNHALLSYNHGKTPIHRMALQAKEKLQGMMRDNPNTEKLDEVNNKYGFSLQEKAETEDEALAEMLMGYYKTHGKLQLGKRLKAGEDLVYNVNDLELVD